ncbi:MAG: hypothetical protein ACM3ML_15580 [Micromonosporaceae bacterium]
MAAASAAVALAACGGSPRAGGTTGADGGSASLAARHGATHNVHLIGKIDADTGAPGTFTGMDGWPAMSPADIHVPAGATVVITISEYDDMVTSLADQSPFLQVMGGTETVNGKRVTSVSNSEIAHTFTIPSLGINVPLPKASMDGPTTVRFTFRAPKAAGTYQWLCVTPCGGDPDGVGGAMHTNGWMRGHLIVS